MEDPHNAPNPSVVHQAFGALPELVGRGLQDGLPIGGALGRLLWVVTDHVPPPFHPDLLDPQVLRYLPIAAGPSQDLAPQPGLQDVWQLSLSSSAMMGLISSSATGGETPRLTHVSHDTLVTTPFDDVFILGGTDFRTEFNRLDGFGDPSRPGFNRVRGPDANACVRCHDKVNDDKGHVSVFGGTGDIVVAPASPSRWT